MKKRVFRSILLSSLFTLLLASSLIILFLYSDFTAERKHDLIIQASYISKALDETGIDYLKSIGHESTSRLTLVSPDGTVLYDNFADAATLGNHLDRPEIAEAVKKGSGVSTRLSDTLRERTYYYALRLDNGNILRVSMTTKSIPGVLGNTVAVILLILLLAIVIAVYTARFLTKSIVKPINHLNLDDPVSNNAYDELSPLLLRMDKQNKRINEQLKELEARQNEFDTITDNMNEALVIFGENRHVLLSNKSARRLFGSHAKGAGYLELCRDMEYIRCVEAAFEGKSASGNLSRNGRFYQLSVNPVIGNELCAAVLFAVDVSEKEQNEKIRREFSANVSHELKTPLTIIMGSAEIMQNGIAKQNDYPILAKQIYSESRRLLTLIEDIIKLSRLDEEGMKNEFSKIDLLALSDKVVSELRAKAEENNISLSLEGHSRIISGVEGVLHEMIFNLCDNAITYNKAGGSVTVSVSDSGVILSVRDTGIGIAPEYQPRIFERFYRVDSSRSKETGGTGLGLSIVKHGAMLHHAEIELLSSPGAGTTVKLIFKN